LLLAGLTAFATARPVKKKIQAVYPELAKRMHVAGTVKLEVTIDPSGNVGDVKVLSGHPLLGAAATDAVKRWVFEPGPASTVEEIAIDFSNP
jgi:TonB family protein